MTMGSKEGGQSDDELLSVLMAELAASTAKAYTSLDRTLALLTDSERRMPEIEAAARERAKAEFAGLLPEVRKGDPVIEKWLRDEVTPVYDALKADPSHALSVDQVQAMLAAKRVMQTIYNLDRAEAFRQAEASLRLEGLDPTGDAHYEAVKARVLTGELTFDEGKAEILAHHRQRSAASPSE